LPNAEQLASAAEEIGLRDRVDPGHVVLNFAYSGQDLWHIANAALRLLDSGNTAIDIMKAKMGEYFDWSSISRENAEFLGRITQTEMN